LEAEPSQIFECLFITPLFLTDVSSGWAFYVLTVVLLLICSGLLSGSEVAFFSLTIRDHTRLKEEDTPATKLILKLLDKPRYLLSTILITNNIVNIAIILVSDNLLKLIVPVSLGVYVNFFITVVLVTFLLVLFGEVAPKVYANRNNIQIASIMSRPLWIFGGFFKPLSWVLVNSTNFIETRLEKRLNNNVISQEDIDSAIELTVKDSKYAEQDMDILKGIVRFGNTAAAEIMTPRLKVVAIDIDSSFEEVVQLFKDETFSRVPVYEENSDNIKGILHAKDLLDLIGDGSGWHKKIREALFIPKEKKIDDLFNDFQEKRTHMAIVLDEYGGTEGIVTMEDVLEEIVGEIQDEFDEQEEENIDKVNEYTYDFDGSTPLGEICKVINMPPDFFDDCREGAETIAGLILVLKGKIPRTNTAIHFKSHKIIVLAASKRRIEKVRMVLPQELPQQHPSSVTDNS